MENSAGEFRMECVAKTRELEFVKGLQCLEHKKYVERYFLFSAAPVLTGAKSATLILFRHCCKEVWRECKEQICKETGLDAIKLYENKETFAILIYDKEMLENKVRSLEAKKILHRYGYEADGELCELFGFLKTRFYNCNFPHEIGVFLGYPPEDVGAFIEKSGKDYLCCRYWKVYHNEQEARETFEFIDKAKSHAIYLLGLKVTIKTAARMLAEMKTA